MTAPSPGLGLGQLLLTLDRTMVSLVEAPRGLDMPVGSVAMVDSCHGCGGLDPRRA